ncbi:TonB-dependent receptor [Steroidobacter sp.]|uniref:TonB-dependent receptor n=1 Tax=Steroidobacter sp. TaxID=1978227 RepID=UPI001A5A013F|nr:TonB-dependent receptor [Steroidobacter sp.]MBL8266959.1 TonB-dependent receptor [Steroidobacter sp.]
MNTRSHLAAAATAAVIAGTLPLNVLAQEAASNQGLEEIVVTAQKREQKLQDVPMAVTAVSGAQLEQQGITQFQDLLRSVPGVSFAGTEPGQSRYAIRGVSTEASSPTVGVYLDDISLVSISTNFAGAIDPAFFDFERVEVLKGPQGTLYGGSAMGGAIKYVSRQPVIGENSFSTAAGLSTTRGGDLSYEAEGVANVSVVDDKLAVRGGVSYRKTGGYIDNVANGQTEVWTRSTTLPPAAISPTRYSTLSTFKDDATNERDLLSVRLSAKLTPTDSLSIVPAVFYQKSEKEGTDSYFTNLPDFQSSYRFAQPTDDKAGIYSLTITNDFGPVTLTSISAYVDREVNWDRDYSLFIGNLAGAFFPYDSYNTSDTTTETFTQELRLSGEAFGGRLQWVGGLYYADQEDRLLQIVATRGAGADFGLGTDVTYIGDQRTDSKQFAAFGEVTYEIVSNVDLTLGLRYFDAEQTVNGDFDGIFNGGASTVDNKKSSEDGVTPKVSVTWRATPDNLLYTTASKGFRQGGPNRFNTNSPLCAPDFERLGIDRVPDSYRPDTLWTYEVGSKNQVLDRRATVNAAVYYTDWSKIQQQVNLPTCGFQFVGNVGAAEIKGAELAIEAAATDALTLGGTVSYTDAEISASSPGVSAQVGQSVLDTPEWMGNVYGDFKFQLTQTMDATLRAEYQYRGSSLRQFDTTMLVTYPNATSANVANMTQIQDSYDIVNVNLTVFRGDWQYRLFINNLLDESPYLDFSRTSGESSATTLRPRTIGVGARVNF